MDVAPQYLYKYLSAESFLKVADTMRLQHSRPFAFNDPFDTQIKLTLGVSDDEARDIICWRLYRLASDKQSRIQGIPGKMIFFPGSVVDEKDICRTEEIIRGLNRNDALERIRVARSPWIGMRLASIRRHCDSIWPTNKNVYIFCLSEIHDNILMWSHYAAGHTGVVLELKIKSHGGYRQVIYQRECPSFFDKRFYRFYQMGELSPDTILPHIVASTTKHVDWSYEREWRWIGGVSDNTNKVGNYAYPLLSPNAVSGVFLGSRMNDAYRARVVSTTRERFPLAVIWVGKERTDEFALHFDRLD